MVPARSTGRAAGRRARRRQLPRHPVKLFGAEGVHLIKRGGSQRHRHPAERVLQHAGTEQNAGLTAQNDVGVFRVYVQGDRFHLRPLLGQPPHQLFFMGQAPAVRHDAHRELPIPGAAQIKVTQQTGTALLVVDGEPVFRKEGAEQIRHLAQGLRL